MKITTLSKPRNAKEKKQQLVYKICRTRSHSFYVAAAALSKLAMLPFEESAATCWFTRRAMQLQNFLSEVRWKSGVEEILKTRRKRKQSGFPDEFRKPTRNPKGKAGGRGPHARRCISLLGVLEF
jgi:hypothetical protein